MHDIYSAITGPLFLLSFVLFLCGLIYRIINILLIARKNEQFIFTYISIKHSFESILHWILPFASLNYRKNPILTIFTFLFHYCCILTPLFLLSHIVLLEESCNFCWWTFPDTVSDVMTFIVLISLLFFFVRRILCQEVKFITKISDYGLLLLISIPFFTGFIAYHQYFAYDIFFIIHILSSEIFLILIPHTRLKHMFFFFISQSYIGSEFGKVRGVKNW